jgi:putative NADH-flavin reductase
MNHTPSDLFEVKKLVQDLFEARKVAESIQETLKEQNNKMSAIKQRLTEALTTAGIESFAVPGTGKIAISNIYNWPLPKDEKKAEYYSYIYENGLQDMLTMNQATHNAFLKGKLAEAQAEGRLSLDIPGVGEPTLFQTVKMWKD